MQPPGSGVRRYSTVIVRILKRVPTRRAELFSYPVRGVSWASISTRASSRSRSESEIWVNCTPQPTLGMLYITTPCTEMYSPSGSVSLRLSSSPTSTGPIVSMKHPVALMSTVRARDFLVDPSHVASITRGRRSRFLFSSVIIYPLRSLLGLLLSRQCVTTMYEGAQAREHPSLGYDTPGERYQLVITPCNGRPKAGTAEFFLIVVHFARAIPSSLTCDTKSEPGAVTTSFNLPQADLECARQAVVLSPTGKVATAPGSGSFGARHA